LTALGVLGIMDANQSRFYIGSLLLALESLHSRRIIYRDLKAENILLDRAGYIKLIDFGVAKKLTAVRTHTLIGTPQFMAPEIIHGKGYGLMADIWALGVCLYEFMVGVLPFGNDKSDQWDVWRAILYQPLTFPTWFKQPSGITLMHNLMEKAPVARIGASALGFRSIKQSSFFHGFHWDKLLQRSIEVPYIPHTVTCPTGDVSPVVARQEPPSIRGMDRGNARRGSWHQGPTDDWDADL